jgi:hypothetical protein
LAASLIDNYDINFMRYGEKIFFLPNCPEELLDLAQGVTWPGRRLEEHQGTVVAVGPSWGSLQNNTLVFFV